MLEILNYAGYIAGVAGALALVIASIRSSNDVVKQASIQVWKEEAEAQKSRADRLMSELGEIKERLTNLESHNATLVAVVSTIDPDKLELLRIHRGL